MADDGRAAQIARIQQIERIRALEAKQNPNPMPTVAAMGNDNGPTAAADQDWTDAAIPDTKISARNVGQATANALPTAGAMLGGGAAAAMATPETLGMGTVPAGFAGAAAGGMTGNLLKKSLEKYFDKKNPSGYKAPAMDQLKSLFGMSTLQDVNDTANTAIEGVGHGIMTEAGGKIADTVLPVAIPWIASQTSGIPLNAMRTYMRDAPQVMSMMARAKRPGSLPTQDLERAADTVREETGNAIDSFKKEQSGVVDQALEGAGNARHNVEVPIQALEKAKGPLNPVADAGDVGAIDKTLAGAKSIRDVSASTDPVMQAYESQQKQYLAKMDDYLKAKKDMEIGGISARDFTPRLGGTPPTEPPLGPLKLEPDLSPYGTLANIPPKTPMPVPRELPGPGMPNPEFESPVATLTTPHLDSGNYLPRGNQQPLSMAGPVKPEIPQMPPPMVTSPELLKLQQYLQKTARGGYQEPGQIFDAASPSAAAARDAAAKTRVIFNEAHPTAAVANNKLSQLHELDDAMKASLHTAGTPSGTLTAAGSGANGVTRNQLSDLGELTGNNFVTPAEHLAAMRYYNDPKLLPEMSTGKSMLGMVAGNVLSSPYMQKLGMDTMLKYPGIQAIPRIGGSLLGAPVGDTVNSLINPWSKERMEKEWRRNQAQ